MPGSEDKLSSHVSVWADEEREQARGYRDMRNIVGVGIVSITSIFNVESFGSVAHRLEFNAGGIAVAALAALGMERGRRKLEKQARIFEKRAEELSALDL